MIHVVNNTTGLVSPPYKSLYSDVLGITIFSPIQTMDFQIKGYAFSVVGKECQIIMKTLYLSTQEDTICVTCP